MCVHSGDSPPIKVQAAREEVSDSVGGTRNVMESEVVIHESLHPASLTTGDAMRFMEIHEIVVIGEDAERMTCTEQMVLPMTNGFDNSKKFVVVDVVFQFHGLEGSREEGDRVLKSVVLELGQRHADGKGGGICLESKWLIIVYHPQNWMRHEVIFERDKGCLLCR